MSSDSEYEEEEFHIFADFKNQLLPKEISSHPIKIIGIETKNPIAELNGNVFKGTYDFAMGTNVFFEKDTTETTVDTLFEETCRQKYKYFTHANKVINFQRIYVEKKLEDSVNVPEDIETTNPATVDNKLDDLKVNMSYDEAIGQFPLCEEKK